MNKVGLIVMMVFGLYIMAVSVRNVLIGVGRIDSERVKNRHVNLVAGVAGLVVSCVVEIYFLYVLLA